MTRPVFARGTGTSPAGPAGRDGTNGANGLNGLPGVNAVANDTATAAYIGNPTSATASALSVSIDAQIQPYKVGDLTPIAGALAAIYSASDARADVMVTGDSILEGYTASDVAHRGIDVMQTRLRARFGPAVQGAGFLPARYIATRAGGGVLPWPFAYSGSGWDEANAYWGPGFKGRRGSPGAASFSSRAFTSVKVLIVASGTGNQVHFQVDGTAGVDVTIPGGNESHYVWDSRSLYPDLVSGVHGLAVNVLAGNPVFAGAIFYDGDEAAGVMVIDGSQSGAKAADLAGNTNPNSHWIDCLGVFVSPKLMVNSVITNDSRTVSNGYDVATYKALQQNYIDRVRAKLPNVPILFAPPYQHDQDTIAPWGDYVEALRQLAESNPYVAVFALSSSMSISNNDPFDLSSDGVHPTDRGHRLIGEMLASVLSTFPVKYPR